MDQTMVSRLVTEAHKAVIDRIVENAEPSLLNLIDFQRSEIKRLQQITTDLGDAMEGILKDYAERCREVANLRVALKADTIDKQYQMEASMGSFALDGIGAQYYQMPYDFVFESVDLCKPSNVK